MFLSGVSGSGDIVDYFCRFCEHFAGLLRHFCTPVHLVADTGKGLYNLSIGQLRIAEGVLRRTVTDTGHDKESNYAGKRIGSCTGSTGRR